MLVVANKTKMEGISVPEQLDSIYFTHLSDQELAPSKEEVNDLSADILLNLSNSPSAVEKMKEKQLKPLFEAVQAEMPENEHLSDKFMAILTCLSS